MTERSETTLRHSTFDILRFCGSLLTSCSFIQEVSGFRVHVNSEPLNPEPLNLIFSFQVRRPFGGRHGLGIPLALDYRQLFRFAELQAVSSANRDTGRPEPGIDAIHAVITFDHFADFRIPLRRPPGTGGNTSFAPHTQIVIHKDDAVFFPALHGAGGAGGNTPGVLTVKTGHKDKRRPGPTVEKFRAHLNDLAGPCRGRQGFIGFTLDFA